MGRHSTGQSAPAIRSRLLRLPRYSKLGGITILVASGIYLELTVGGLGLSEKTVALIIGIAAISAAAAQPGWALGFILVFVPLQVAVLSLVYRAGAPLGLTRDLGFTKDAMVVGICVAAVRHRRRGRGHRRSFDSLDAFAVAYVGVATAYLLIPIVIAGSLGGEGMSTRIDAWRVDCLFVVLMVAARRIPFSAATLVRERSLVLGVAVVLAAFVLMETFAQTSYNNLLVHTLHVPQYQQNVLRISPPPGNDYVIRGTLGGANFVRAGSLFVDSLALGFYAVLPLCLGVEQLAESRPRPFSILGTAAAGLTLVLTLTRSAILSGMIGVALSVYLSFRRLAPARIRLAIVVACGLLLLIPLAAGTSVGNRFSSAFSNNNNSSDTDTQQHKTASQNGLHEVISHPSGRGLGANPATGQRDKTANVTVTENSYLQVGTELGVTAMLAFVGMYLALLSKLRVAFASRDDGGQIAGGVWLSGCGLLIGGLFLQVWIGFAISLSFWGLAGAALGWHDRDREVTDDDQRLTLLPAPSHRLLKTV